MAWPSLLARTKDWGSEILTDADLEGQFDLIINYINAMMDASTGHKHDATTSEAPKIDLTTSVTGILPVANGGSGSVDATYTTINIDGGTIDNTVVGGTTPAAGTFTTIDATTSIQSEYYLLDEQGSAPATAANQGALYTKETGGQSELYYREESSGDEIQLTNAGSVNSSAGIEVFTSNGTFTAPAGVTHVWISGVGGGGGGGGARNNADGGGGGGAGAWVKDVYMAVTAGNTYAVTIGAKGTGGATGDPGADGTGGTATTFVGDTAPYNFTITCNAGGLGNGGRDGGGSGTGGAGGAGQAVQTNYDASGQTAGTVSSTGYLRTAGGAGGTRVGGTAGGGGASFFGNGGNGGTSGSAGSNASGYGAGGGGGGGSSGAGAGGDGTDGILIVRY